jgi:dolichol-phosphate mannosyltransferase
VLSEAYLKPPGLPPSGNSNTAETCSAAFARTSDTLVFFPTYNEAQTIEPMLSRLLALPIRFDILIVDDSSTDGTTQFIESIAKTNNRVRLIVRRGKLGIGSAHRLGWMYARRQGYSRIVSLDADLSHDPWDIPRLLAALDAGADVALASRYAPGGHTDYRGWRLFLSNNANRFARPLLGLPFYEYTTSFRAAKLDRVPPGLVEGIARQGYGFFLSCVVGLAREELAITEIPIHFRDRHRGASKIPRLEIFRGIANLVSNAIDRRPAKRSALSELACPACGSYYRVATRSGAILCLECLETDQSAQSCPAANFPAGAC